MNVNSVIHKL